MLIRVLDGLGEILGLLCSVVVAGTGYMGTREVGMVGIGLPTAIILMLLGGGTFLVLTIRLILAKKTIITRMDNE